MFMTPVFTCFWQLMEEEENTALHDKYVKGGKFTFVEIKTSKIDMVNFNIVMNVYIMHNGQLVKLFKPCKTGQDPTKYTPEGFQCNAGEEKVSFEVLYTVHPTFTDMYPQIGVSQGGTEVAVHGNNFPVWAESGLPLLIAQSDDEELAFPIKSVSEKKLVMETPPQLLNSTDVYATSIIFVSFNRQRYYRIPFPFTQHDPSRIHWGDAIAISHLHNKEFVMSSGPKYRSRETDQQIVTMVEEQSDTTLKYFVVKEPLPVLPADVPSAHRSHDAATATPDYMFTGDFTRGRKEGSPVLCNSTIRLLHARTNRFLSTRFDALADSSEQEVSLNGADGNGDTDDNFVVTCEQNTRHGYSWKFDDNENRWSMFNVAKPVHQRRIQWMLDNNNEWWRPSTVVRFYHPNSGKYLDFNNIDITNKGCPFCYRERHKELAMVDYTAEGDRQRFMVKRQTRQLVECTTLKEALPTRWRLDNRDIRKGDFVVWREGSPNKCVVTGPHPVNKVGFKMDTRFGKVVDVFSDSSTIHVEEYEERADIYSKRYRKYTSTPWRQKRLLSLSSVHGPVVTKHETPAPHVLTANVTRSWVKAYFQNTAEYAGIRVPD